MGKNVKTLDFLRWLQLSKRPLLTFLPGVQFAMRRPGVRSPSGPPKTLTIPILTESREREIAAQGDPHRPRLPCFAVLSETSIR